VDINGPVGVGEMEAVSRLGDVAPLPAEALREARATLRAAVTVEDLVPTGGPEAGDPERGQRVRRPRRTCRPRRVVTAVSAAALGAVAAAVVALVVASSVGPGVPGPSHPTAPAPPKVDRPLAQLADYIQANTPQPTGDATLVLRTQSYPNSPSISGADLYTDSGEYFYAPTESGLPAAIAADANEGDGMFAREVQAAKEAVTGDVATAAHEMAVAPFPGGVWPAAYPAAALKIAAAEAAQAAAAGKPVPTTVPTIEPTDAAAPSVPTQGQIDNYIWMDSLDALSAGAGNPQVRIGVLRILATLPEVTVTNTTTNGEPTVTLTAKAPALPADYQEALTIDASTGVPVAFAGGTPGQPPSVTVTYQVSRVTVSNIAAGQF